jgi:hypothetical protein
MLRETVKSRTKVEKAEIMATRARKPASTERDMSPAQAALTFAVEASRTAKTWIDLHNQLFGIGGRCGQLFPSQPERIAFSKTPEFKQINELIEELQDRDGTSDQNFAATLASANGNVLVRLPKSIHASLLVEAESEGVSLNQLILAKLATQLRAVA